VGTNRSLYTFTHRDPENREYEVEVRLTSAGPLEVADAKVEFLTGVTPPKAPGPDPLLSATGTDLEEVKKQTRALIDARCGAGTWSRFLVVRDYGPAADRYESVGSGPWKPGRADAAGFSFVWAAVEVGTNHAGETVYREPGKGYLFSARQVAMCVKEAPRLPDTSEVHGVLAAVRAFGEDCRGVVADVLTRHARGEGLGGLGERLTAVTAALARSLSAEGVADAKG
jgi:hypothetical protein